jgi:hypothetical protein
MRFQRNSGQTGTGQLTIAQSFESVNAIPFAGKTVILSFYARAGANYSPTSSALLPIIFTGTGTDQNALSGYTGNVTNYTSVTLTTTWQRFTYSITVPITATEIAPAFGMNPTGTAGTNDYYEVTGVQIDIGSVALPFRTYAGTLQGELAACQRYYFRMNQNVTQAIVTNCTALSDGTRNVDFVLPVPVPMRIYPTSFDYTNIGIQDGVTSYTGGTWAIGNYGMTGGALGASVRYTHGVNLVALRVYQLASASNAATYLGLSAEL